jgi:hypothetical protein
LPPHGGYTFFSRRDNGRPLSDREIEGLHRKHLLDVELVHVEQVSLLRCLVKHGQGLAARPAEWPFSKKRVIHRPLAVH